MGRRGSVRRKVNVMRSSNSSVDEDGYQIRVISSISLIKFRNQYSTVRKQSVYEDRGVK